jgi:tetrahydromethanopterin S-methyltransferase subunit G
VSEKSSPEGQLILPIFDPPEDPSCRQLRDVLYCTPMAQTDFERFTRLMLDEFGRVHERFDKHDERFDRIDARLTNHDQRFDNIDRELHSIRTELDDLHEKVDNITGYRKEIDHALGRIAAIEQHLGLDRKISA